MGVDINIFKRFNFYNRDIKLEFLSQIESESSAITFAYALEKATSTEKMFNQDLYDFNLKQIELVMSNIDPVSYFSSMSYVSQLRSYINWAYSNRYKNSNINVLAGVSNEWIKSFVTTQKTIYSEPELRQIEDQLANYQDAIILRLAFNGVIGTELFEMESIKFSHLKGNQLTIPETDTSSRTIEVDDRTVELITKAFYEEEYKKKNGEAVGKARTSPYADVPYIVKKFQGRESFGDKVGKFTIMRRLRMIKELFEAPLLSTKNLEKSGMLHHAYLLSRDSGEFGKEDFEKLAKRFNLPEYRSSDGYLYYNKTIQRNILNSENMKETYNVDINFTF